MLFYNKHVGTQVSLFLKEENRINLYNFLQKQKATEFILPKYVLFVDFPVKLY